MNNFENQLLPPSRLAIAYAPYDIREQFSLLLRFDSRFGSIVGAADDIIIAQIKIAWWRDALLAASNQRPRGEPMLTALFDIDQTALTCAVASLADAWESLLVTEQWSRESVRDFARQRGSAIFTGYAELAGLEAVPLDLAESWATDDLRSTFGTRVLQFDPAYIPLPRSRRYRPLTILALSARRPNGFRLIWHALTGW